MKKLGIVAAVVLALALLAAVATACVLPTYSYDANEVTGGGWLDSAADGDDGSKATFAFQGQLLECVPDELVYLQTYCFDVMGHLEYHDHGLSCMKGIHGNVEKMVVSSDMSGNICTEFTGTYRTQPKEYCGTFKVQVIDNGEPGVNDGDGDQFFIYLNAYGSGWSYSNGGHIGGGNIQFHPVDGDS